jgi:predicted ATPase/DNA-binding XRE family transcriptional regulator
MAAVAASDVSASFGEALRDHRRAAGLTQEELAERAGVSPRSISGFERGDAHVPRRDTVTLLARALGLAGADREAFESIVDRRRGPRLSLGLAPPPPSASRTKVHHAGHNVPRALTTFVGREGELDDLAAVLGAAPLLTLVGPGGVGKTRLAHELVRRNVDDYADGCWIVELAPLADPALLVHAVAAAVGLRDFQARDSVETLTEFLRPKHLLLVLDNCEHLIGPVARLAEHLLRMCPSLHVLATSREPFAITGEATWRVPPLELPDGAFPRSVDELARSPAVRLFLDRARAVNASLALTADNAPAIERICAGVAGIPLGLELAAARTRAMTIEQLADRLERDVGILSGTDRAALPRHQTLRATIDWSHDSLAEEEQIVLRRLSVFASGWTLDTAEEVVSDARVERADILPLVAQLVDKSMVQVDAHERIARYRLLEPIRQYALERLDTSGEADTFHARHSTAMLQLARTGNVDGYGTEEVVRLDRLETELGNLRAALSWALEHHDHEVALRASAGLFRFWERRGHFQEGCAWLEQALAAASDVPAQFRGRALNALAFLYWRGGNAERARAVAEQALALNRLAGRTVDVAWALGNLGMIAYLRHEHELAVARLEESVRLAREAGHGLLLSVALTFVGRTRMWVNGPHDPLAAAALEEALALAEGADSLYARCHALATLGDLLWGTGEAKRAVPLWRHALAVGAQLADRRAMAGCLERLALALAASDRLEPAAWLFGAADAEHRMLGMELRSDAEADHAHFVAVTREHFGDEYDAAWSAGQAAPLDEVVLRAFDETEHLSPRPTPAQDRDRYELAGGVTIPRPWIARAR